MKITKIVKDRKTGKIKSIEDITAEVEVLEAVEAIVDSKEKKR